MVGSVNKWYCLANYFDCDYWSISPCPPKSISTVYQGNGCQFLRNVFFFFSRTRFGYTLRKQYWTYLMKSLAIEYCLIDCLKFADVSGSRQHALLIWTFIYSCVLWNMYFQQWNLRRINKGAHIKTLRFNFD